MELSEKKEKGEGNCDTLEWRLEEIWRVINIQKESKCIYKKNYSSIRNPDMIRKRHREGTPVQEMKFFFFGPPSQKKKMIRGNRWKYML